MVKFRVYLRDILIIIVLAYLISLILQYYFLEPRIVPTGSMLPTIQIDQRILVNKISYKFTTPQRGDIIVFSSPEDSDESCDYIKRVIGISGDKIEIKNGSILLNNIKLKEDYLDHKPQYNFGPIVVPKDALFVLGDNRNCSFDSHIWSQWLKTDQVKGKAFFKYWPLESMEFLK